MAVVKKKKVIKKTKEKKEVEEKEIGKVFSYFTNIGVAAINLTGALNVGDKIHIKGATTDFTQKVASMQSNHKEIEKAKKGAEIGTKVKDRVRPHDTVYLVKE